MDATSERGEPKLAWPEANQRSLMAALGVVRAVLERHASRPGNDVPGSRMPGDVAALARESSGTGLTTMPGPSALERIGETFGLSAFERAILLLCAGMELDGQFASLCAAAQGVPQRPFPTFGLALAALAEAHWSALSPDAPLRYWRLIEVGSGDALTTSRLRIDERILHFLTGIVCLDERLQGLVLPTGPLTELAPSHLRTAERLAAAWSREPRFSSLPPLQLCGADAAVQRSIARSASPLVGLGLRILPAHALPGGPTEFEALARLWRREAALTHSALLLEMDDATAADPARKGLIGRWLEICPSPVFLSATERLENPSRPLLTIEVGRPEKTEQRALWERLLAGRGAHLNGQVDRLVAQFDFSVAAIRDAVVNAGGVGSDHQAPSAPVSAPASGKVSGARQAGGEPSGQDLWHACRVQARTRLDPLARRLESPVGWSDLVLPELQMETLREVAAHVRQRARVYDDWGFAARDSRGLGISVLLVGASGTGKTMAAEVLAHDLQLDLYRIDLSSVVSKYIGETERNLRKVFDAAEGGGVILLFDEADALFGKRSEVKDSHDRYANIEVSYLLQRMEAFRGLAILTTNRKEDLDTAFLRRLRFVVQFPFPDAPQRSRIWRGIFPAETPTRDLDVDRLARLNIAGGNIRNMALNAAFLAADEGQPVGMTHLLRAARTEYAKLEKKLTDAETGGWG